MTEGPDPVDLDVEATASSAGEFAFVLLQYDDVHHATTAAMRGGKARFDASSDCESAHARAYHDHAHVLCSV